MRDGVEINEEEEGGRRGELGRASRAVALW